MPDPVERQNYVTLHWLRWRRLCASAGMATPNFFTQLEFCAWAGREYDRGMAQ